MSFIQYFAIHPDQLVIYTAILGLLIGSFLNVVIYRLPVILEKEWTCDCKELLNIPDNNEDNAPFNLVEPRSRCPQCDRQIKSYENIPIISYLFLRGKCAGCGNKISIRYPIIELLTGILSGVIAYKFGMTWTMGGCLVFLYCLIALTFIDIDTQYLPDIITIPLLWIGLLLSLNDDFFVSSQESITGAVSGYTSLWIFSYIFKKLRKKEGMGHGDFKLFAVFGAWLGWQLLPVIIIMSSFVGAIVGICMIIFQGKDKDVRIPFGPYLAAAGFIALIWGNQLTEIYFSVSGIQ